QIGDLDRAQTVDHGKIGEHAGVTPAISRLIEVQTRFTGRDINDVDHARAVDISEMNATPVKLVRLVEPRRVVHRYLRAEAAIAEVGPITHFAVADAHEIR